jgi:tRNA (cmo5U34)-methyltransferase
MSEPADDPARGYDARMGRAMPGYDTLHALVPPLVAQLTGGVGRVLVVGAGTGRECLALAAESPGLTMVGIDPAPAMLAVARQRLAAAGLGADRVRLVEGVVEDLPADGFDAATVVLVLHFLPDDGAKAALLSAIGCRLRPGAFLVLADLAALSPPEWRDTLYAVWAECQRKAGFGPDEIARGFRHVERAMHPIDAARLSDLLAQAGFAPPRPVFSALALAGWVAEKR